MSTTVIRQYFNPRSRVGNDIGQIGLDLVVNISIHVPAWGTTLTATGFSSKEVISIHVPAWGTTAFRYAQPGTSRFQSTFPRGERPIMSLYLSPSTNFNPRSRVGNDVFSLCPACNYPSISIHVPAWGTTGPEGRVRSWRYFNPRSRVGNDLMAEVVGQASFDFNPRSRVGNDGTLPFICKLDSKISIHVPAWGTTCSRSEDDTIFIGISIHVPAWGTTITLCKDCRYRTISIHVPAWGTTL